MKPTAKLTLSFIASTAAMAVAGGAIAQPAAEGGRKHTIELTGEAELAGGVMEADLDGSGTAEVTVNVGQRRVCWSLVDLDDLSTLVAAHIHEAPADETGGIVVTFFHFGEPIDLAGCATDLDRDLLRRIASRPQSFYVNVHTDEFPGGAIRGQLAHRR